MKTAALLLVTAALCCAASWDGTKGDITVSTYTQTVRNGAFDFPVMTITVACANPAVTTVRVTITIHAGDFTSTDSRLVQITPRGRGNAVFQHMSEDNVTAPPTVTLLVDGASVQF